MAKALVLAALLIIIAIPARADSILANTLEKVRLPGPGGFAKPIHGKIHINGHVYPFVSGGHGRGAAPLGEYRVGPLGGFTAPRGSFVPGFPLSDAYDPMIGDTRDGLFIHPGHHASAGCFAIESGWNSFVADMKKAGTNILFLGHQLDELFDPEPEVHYAHSKGRGHHVRVAHKHRHARTRTARHDRKSHRSSSARSGHHSKRHHSIS